MKAPKTPSPKRVRGDDGLTNSPASSTTSTESHRLPDLSSSKESPVKEREGKKVTVTSKSRTSLLTTAVIFVFCAGLAFFTLESIRYAGTVGRFAAIHLEEDPPTVPHPTVARFSEETSKVSPARSAVEEAKKQAKKPKKAKKTTKKGSSQSTSEPTKETMKRKVVPSKARTQLKVRGHHGEKTKIIRRLKMGRGRRRRGGMGMGGGGITNFRNDLLFLNGGFVPRPAPNVETTPQLQMIMTNVQILQPGIGFLPQGATLILAPAPRRMRGMGMGRSRSKGSSRSRVFRPLPTPFPTIRPTPEPTAQQTQVLSSSPSQAPSRQPSITPSSQPSVSKAPSLQPSMTPSSNPSASISPSSTPSAKAT